MKKSTLKFFALVLSLTLLTAVLSGCSLLRAIGNAVWNTGISFEDLKYEDYDMTAFNELCDEISKLLDDNADSDVILSKMDDLSIKRAEIYSMYSLATIYNAIDVTDEKYADAVVSSYEKSLKADDDFSVLARRVTESDCADAAREYWGDEAFEYYSTYEPMSQEDNEFHTREQELINEYNNVLASDISVTYNGVTVSYSNISSLGLNEEEYYEALALVQDAYKKECGEIFARLVSLRCDYFGRDNYALATYQGYMRDYTTNDANRLYDDVKKYAVPLYASLSTEQNNNDIYEFLTSSNGLADASLLSKLGGKLGAMSDDFSEAFNFMKRRGYYNVGYSEKKMQASFTSLIYGYNVPFLFIQPALTSADIFTFVHEFGHYNAMFHSPLAECDLDLTEIPSSALELLFCERNPDVFGEHFESARLFSASQMLSSLIVGCMINEFETEIYSERMTDIDDIDELFIRLCAEYGVAEFSWAEVPHLFMYPFYYISYSVSALSAMDIWLSSCEDFDSAFKKYMLIAAEDGSRSCREAVKAAGVMSIFDDNAIRLTVERLENILEVTEEAKAAA